MNISKEVVCAMADHSTGAARRAALRKLAEAELLRLDKMNSGQTTAFIVAAATHYGAKRHTVAGVRDVLPMRVLLALALQYWSDPAGLLGSFTNKAGPFRNVKNDVFDDLSRLLIKARTSPNSLLGYVNGTSITIEPDALTASGASQPAAMTPLKLGATMTNTKMTLPQLQPDQTKILDAILATCAAPSYGEIAAKMADYETEIAKLANGPGGVTVELPSTLPMQMPASGTAPGGNVVMKRACDVFGITGGGKKIFDFDVITFDYGGAQHPAVPVIDPDYAFDPDNLLKVLTALLFNRKAWLYGHTGTGKTTLIEQVAARLGWPVVRINFDSEITRLDMIGRDVITTNGGQTVTAFVDGVLPQAMQTPSILLCDEMDFIRPDVAYVMQRALEDKGLLVTEDGGRLVQPHPYFRMIATANTKGAGDDTGRYMGARPQSGAFLNRFTTWIGVDYMAPAALEKLLKAKTQVEDAVASIIAKYAKEHWHGFMQNDLMQDLSPRNLVACADTYTFYKGLMPQPEALKKAFEATIFNRASTDHDAQTMRGLFQRVTK